MMMFVRSSLRYVYRLHTPYSVLIEPHIHEYSELPRVPEHLALRRPPI